MQNIFLFFTFFSSFILTVKIITSRFFKSMKNSFLKRFLPCKYVTDNIKEFSKENLNVSGDINGFAFVDASDDADLLAKMMQNPIPRFFNQEDFGTLFLPSPCGENNEKE